MNVRDVALARIVDMHIQNALSLGELTEDQADALDYYYGRPYGNEKEGQSQIVTRETMEVIEWAMPSMMRIFATEKAVEFDPVGPEDVDAASQETDAVRHVAWKYSDGFTNTYNWAKDGLMQRVGYAKVYVETEEETVSQKLEGLTAEDVNMLDPNTMTDIEELQMDDGSIFYSVTLEQTNEKKCVKWMTIEPEHVRVAKRIDAVCLDDATFVAHVEEYTQSELIEMGFDRKTVEALPSYTGDEADTDSVDYARAIHSGEDDDENDWAEEATRPIEVWECYVRTDYNEDGVAELMKVMYAGDKILSKEEIDDVPIIAWSPIPMPHQHAGLSLADLVMDLQKINSTLNRQVLDNLYLTNNPEKEVVWNNVLVPDDMLQSVPGGIKRVKERGTVTPLTVPFTAGASLPMMEYLDKMKESRTGISKHTMGLDADTLAKSTKGAYLGALEQANSRLELIARMFAESALKKLYLKIHSLMIENMDEGLRIQLSGEYVDVSPSSWTRRTDMTVTVGTGNASVEQRAMLAQRVLEIQEKVVAAGGMGTLVTTENIYNAASDFVEAIGRAGADRYFTNPSQSQDQQQPQQEDPTQQLMMMQAQIEQMREEGKRMKDQQEMQIKMLKLQLDEREQTRKEIETEAEIGRDIVDLGARMNAPQVMPE